MAVPSLKHWSFIRRFSKSKGGVREYLTGDVYGDPDFPDGTRIVTSAIVSHDDHNAVTASGAHYVLDGEAEFSEAPGTANDLTQAFPHR
jgi:hypothetical protein